jgi:hypothetical protein
MIRTLLQILWPAFLGAGVLELLVFAHVDPGDVHTLGGVPLGLSRQAVYTLTFFGLWGVVAAACGLTWILLRRSEDLNRRD